MEPVIKVENIEKTIKGKRIINDLSFELFKGEVLGFLGENGAGKTTTLRMLTGLIKITNGKASVNGHNISTSSIKAKAKIGAIIENPEFYNYMSGWNNIKYFASLNGKYSNDDLKKTVRLLGMEERIHDKVGTYSLGMKQRLGLIQALVHNPNVLILDEPLNGLDPSGVREFRQLIIDIAKNKGISIIISSHQISEIELMCNRIMIIKNGTIVNFQDVSSSSQAEETYKIELNNPSEAIDILNQKFNGIEFHLDSDSITFKSDKESISKINQLLIKNDFEVYSISKIHESLEEKFFEITTGKGQ